MNKQSQITNEETIDKLQDLALQMKGFSLISYAYKEYIKNFEKFSDTDLDAMEYCSTQIQLEYTKQLKQITDNLA